MAQTKMYFESLTKSLVKFRFFFHHSSAMNLPYLELLHFYVTPFGPYLELGGRRTALEFQSFQVCNGVDNRNIEHNGY